MKKVIKIVPIIIGIIIVGLLLMLMLKPIQNVFIRAEDIKPVDVNFPETTENSAKVSWTTARETQSVIEYGTSPTDLNYFAPESSRTSNHSIDLTLLVPGTTYYFQIKVGDQKFDNSGVPWTFSTKGSGDATSVKPTISLETTPISSVEIKDQAVPIKEAKVSCDDTDCLKIRSKLGKGCSTADYFKCLNKTGSTQR